MNVSFRGFLLIFTAIAAVAINRAQAVDLEVDNVRGSDLQTRSIEGLATPYRTIQRAVDHAIVGDTIRIRETGQPYRECVSINTNHALGTPDFPLIIDGGGATLDGSQTLGVLDWTALGRDLFELNVRSPGHVHFIAAGDQPTPENMGTVTNLAALEPFQYARNTGSVFFRTRPGDVPQAYGLRVTKEQTGITLYDVSNLVIRNMTVTGYRLDGINCHDLVDNVRFENITAIDNGRSGISVGGASQALVTGGTFRGNGKAQLRTEGQSLLEWKGATIEAGRSQAIEQAGGRIVENDRDVESDPSVESR